MGLKSFVFSCLPESIQHKIIMQKTGFRYVEDAYFTPTLRGSVYIPPKSETWARRFSKPYGHEPEIVKWFERNLRKEDVVFDVGAHLGYFGMLVNKIHPGVSFTGFEGNWFIASYQKMNRTNMGCEKNWTIVEKLIGNKDEHPFLRIDTYLQKHPSPTIFQMDVDGEEINVLSGAFHFLKAAKTTFLVEVHPKDLADRGQTVDAFLSLFDPSLYDFSYLPQLRSLDARWTDHLSANDLTEEFYLLANPKGKLRL
jgi:hypothetical protein